MKLKTFFLVQFFLFFALFGETAFDVFPVIDGFQKNEKIESYNPDNLYDYINGAADSYLNYDFEKLYLQRYKGKDEQSIKIEIYKHSNKTTSFGIYSSERPFRGNWVNVGAQGYYEKGILNFYKGQFYIKMMMYKVEKSDEEIILIASKIAENLSGSNETPETYKLFPSEAKVDNSEKYIHKNFLGYESFEKAYTVDYETNDTNFEMFLIELDNKTACKKMLDGYFDAIKTDTIQIKEGTIVASDPYLGIIYFLWTENTLIGITNCKDQSLAEKYLRKVLENLSNNN